MGITYSVLVLCSYTLPVYSVIILENILYLSLEVGADQNSSSTVCWGLCLRRYIRTVPAYCLYRQALSAGLVGRWGAKVFLLIKK